MPSTSTSRVFGPPAVAHAAALPASLVRVLHLLLLAAALVLLGFHTAHLTADFPNNSPWKDWSKYTDEGWYGDAAIRHFQLGHWYVPGDFNPGAALPVWPLLEGIVFRVTGVSLLAARALTVAVFAGICVAAWLLIERWKPESSSSSSPRSLAASAAVLLLTASPFIFVFTRLAILEPLLILLTLLALLTVSAVRLPPALPPAPGGRLRRQGREVRAILRSNLGPAVLLAILLPTLILTKTTGLFLVPAIAFLLFATLECRVSPMLRFALPVAGAGMALWLVYYVLLADHHLLLDYRYLFSANGYTGIDRQNFFSVLHDTVTDGMWMGRLFYPCALAAAGVALVSIAFNRHLLRLRPLVPTLLLWIAGYAFFLAYHDNLQPRYYLVIAIPLTLLLPVAIEQFVFPTFSARPVRLVLLGVAAAVVLAISIPEARQTIAYTRHPQYTLLEAARSVDAYINADRRTDPTHNPLLLSISGSDISLMTGLPSICDDFGTLELPDRVRKYRPGWYAAWNDVEDDKMQAMAPLYQLQRVAQFPAMDDPERNLLILYKLIPAMAPAAAPAKGKSKPTPRRLRTQVGQQPSVTQLEH